MVVVLCTSSYDAYGNICMKFYEHILNGFVTELLLTKFKEMQLKEYPYKSYGSCTLHVV